MWPKCRHCVPKEVFLIYLDWAATAIPEASLQAEALQKAMQCYGNPSSLHGEGKLARSLFETSRDRLASAIFPESAMQRPSDQRSSGKKSGALVFTGSGTEADQIALLSLVRSAKYGRQGTEPPHLVISAIEHPAVFAQAHVMEKLGFEVSLIRPDASGCLPPSKVADALRPSTVGVAVMAVNNETGAIQDIGGISAAIASAADSLHMKRPLFHVDCVQALGKIRLGFPCGAVDSAAFSAHKIGGPRSVGALWLNTALSPLAVGGGQEGGIRSGTENLFGALAFAACAEKAARNLGNNLKTGYELAELLISGIQAIPGALILPACRKARDDRYSPWVLSAAFPGLSGEVFARALSDAGFAVSTGSACSHTHRSRDSRVIVAMGIPEEIAFSSIRISMGPMTSRDDIAAFLAVAGDLYRRLKT